jgi:hypothetical protein
MYRRKKKIFNLSINKRRNKKYNQDIELDYSETSKSDESDSEYDESIYEIYAQCKKCYRICCHLDDVPYYSKFEKKEVMINYINKARQIRIMRKNIQVNTSILYYFNKHLDIDKGCCVCKCKKCNTPLNVYIHSEDYNYVRDNDIVLPTFKSGESSEDESSESSEDESGESSEDESGESSEDDSSESSESESSDSLSTNDTKTSISCDSDSSYIGFSDNALNNKLVQLNRNKKV